MPNLEFDTEVTIWFSGKTGRIEYICKRGLRPEVVGTVSFMYAAISGVHAQLLALAEGVERDVLTITELGDNSLVELRYHDGWYSFTIKVGCDGLPKNSPLVLTHSIITSYTVTT